MLNDNLKIRTLPEKLVIYKLTPDQEVPFSSNARGVYSITKTMDEISIITGSPLQIDHVKSDYYWRAFYVNAILDFSEVGILYRLIRPLKENNISVFVISTFNTDYILVKEDKFEEARMVLIKSEEFDMES